MREQYADQAAKVEPKQSQILTGFNALEGTLEEAEKAVALLVEAVQPVSRNEPPRAEKDGPQAITSMCQVAERIRRATDRVQALVNAAHSARNRIEL